MRSFFNKPSWATSGDEDISQDLFRRTDKTYADIITARKEKRDRPTNSHVDMPQEDCKARKRQLTSLGNDQHLEENTDIPLTQDDGPKNPPESDSRNTPLHDGDNSDARKSMPPGKSSNFDELDTVNQKPDTSLNGEAGANTAHVSPTPDDVCASHQLGDDPHLLSSNRDALGYRYHNAVTSPPRKKDVTVQILITSKIENTKPLIVHRKMSQSLRDVRLAWCGRQNLPNTTQSSIYLTWKGKRLFDVTTCNSLRIGTKGYHKGSLDIDDWPQNHADQLRIHMEAVTDDPLLSSDKRRLSGDDLTAACESLEVKVGKQQTDQVVLKCPGLVEWHANISGDTKVSELVDAFRGARDIPGKRELYLTFDGDRLEANACVSSYDITDGDLIDVIIK
ncbi:hypothetical protein FE257_002297 [Aspergillus nanangensis]|uniref:Rad60/SUMO-like domain-containing protein n=1 Tax=Aspergillus nanangensis TaxID=2582783 RepID=A0AAD4CCS4_ASPNN|nr:hypothetical protein FE257_002297 [Aspergillus nanangensis]